MSDDTGSLRVISAEPIELEGGHRIEIDQIKEVVDTVNRRLRILRDKTQGMALNIFSVLDFRMLSGLIGEIYVSEFSNRYPALMKNPNIDGYPDLLNVSRPSYRKHAEQWRAKDLKMFVNFKYGGIEIKNTFGTKKAKAELIQGDSRIEAINTKMDWKAHHRYTNNLLAFLSDYIAGCPQIVAAFYSATLHEDDWNKKQNPKSGSAMTSFSVIGTTGCAKLRSGLRLCRDADQYLKFCRS